MPAYLNVWIHLTSILEDTMEENKGLEGEIVQELQAMASEQMKRLFEIQAKEKEDNDMSGIPF